MRPEYRWAAIGWLTVAGAAGADSFSAVVDWPERVNLGVPVSGIVAAVVVEVGDRVGPGQELLRLDATPFNARGKRAEAAVKHAGAVHAEQVRALERAQELYDRGALSTVELDHAKLAQVEAESALRAAEAEAELAQYELDRSRIEAPFDAWVVARDINPGEIVSSEVAPRTLLTLAPAGTYAARARVDRAALGALEKGHAVRVRLGDRTITGTVHRIVRTLVAGEAEAGYAVDVRFAADVAPYIIGDAVTVEWP